MDVFQASGEMTEAEPRGMPPARHGPVLADLTSVGQSRRTIALL